MLSCIASWNRNVPHLQRVRKCVHMNIFSFSQYCSYFFKWDGSYCKFLESVLYTIATLKCNEYLQGKAKPNPLFWCFELCFALSPVSCFMYVPFFFFLFSSLLCFSLFCLFCARITKECSLVLSFAFVEFGVATELQS